MKTIKGASSPISKFLHYVTFPALTLFAVLVFLIGGSQPTAVPEASVGVKRIALPQIACDAKPPASNVQSKIGGNYNRSTFLDCSPIGAHLEIGGPQGAPRNDGAKEIGGAQTVSRPYSAPFIDDNVSSLQDSNQLNRREIAFHVSPRSVGQGIVNYIPRIGNTESSCIPDEPIGGGQSLPPRNPLRVFTEISTGSANSTVGQNGNIKNGSIKVLRPTNDLSPHEQNPTLLQQFLGTALPHAQASSIKEIKISADKSTYPELAYQDNFSCADFEVGKSSKQRTPLLILESSGLTIPARALPYLK